MTAEELQQQLVGIGIVCRIQREECQIETCRFCGNTRWNLGLNASRGLYHCWACNESGRLDVLLREWLGQGDIHIPVRSARTRAPTPLAPPAPFSSVPAYDFLPASRHLANRRITAEVAQRYGLVVCTEKSHQLYGRLVVPVHDFWTNKLLGHVGRALTGAKPKYLSTLPVRSMSGYRVRGSGPCVIVEGAFDGIAVHRAGHHAAVLGGIAVPRVQEFAARLSPKLPIVVMLDGEAREQAERLYWAIYSLRTEAPVHLFPLPAGADPADFDPQVLVSVLNAFEMEAS